MSRGLRYACLASAAVHVLATAALLPPSASSPPPVLIASLRPVFVPAGAPLPLD